MIADENKFAFLSPKWILENGKEENVSAWRSPGIRVRKDVFLTQFEDGGTELQLVLQKMYDKLTLLDYQNKFLERESKLLSKKLQGVIDDNKTFSIIPRTLKGIYEVCFFMDKIDRMPDSPNIWLVYLSSFKIDDMSSIDFARYMYAFDFVYFKCQDFKENELRSVKRMILNSIQKIQCQIDCNNQEFKTDINESLKNTILHLLFSINLLEDIQQDSIVNFNLDIDEVNRIFELIPNVSKIAKLIKSSNYQKGQ